MAELFGVTLRGVAQIEPLGGSVVDVTHQRLDQVLTTPPSAYQGE